MNLLYTLGYKEWIKTRRVWGLVSLVFLAALAYTLIDLTHTIRMDGAVNVWYGCIFNLTSVAPVMKWLPALAGLLVALSQFVPEMTNKRLKLTLHLPASEGKILWSMLWFGVLGLTSFLVGVVLLLAIGISIWLPDEVVVLMLQQLLPWIVAGISVYGLTAWVCLEPQWRQRIGNALIAVALLAVLFLSDLPGVYMDFSWGMAVVLGISMVFPFYACMRFKEGVQ